MLQEGVGPFGDATPRIQVGVLSPVLDEAWFVTQSLPTTMTAGQRYDITIRMRNTGASTWTGADGFTLLSQRPQANDIWGTSNVGWQERLTSVSPGTEVTFSIPVIAPAAEGSYTFEWRMTHNGLGFGDFTPAIQITVVK
jgi:hypothetical protein